MASETLLFFVLMLSSVPVGKSAETLFNLKCEPAVGVIGQTTHISCSTELQPGQTGRVVINTVVLTRFRETKPCFTFQPFENRVTGDSRFRVESLPSLQLHNTEISDEGGYRYYIRTSLGNNNAEFRINVTAKYSTSIITSEPTEIESGGAVDLYCTASGGYPAGTIHWFDQGNTNWTQNSKVQITQGHDGLFTLSSKLSFRSIDSNWTPFRCVVLNNRYKGEGESTSTLEIKVDPMVTPHTSSTMKSGIAGVIVIGSLIVGLLFVLLFRRRRSRRPRSFRIPARNEDDYEKAADDEETQCNA